MVLVWCDVQFVWCAVDFGTDLVGDVCNSFWCVPLCDRKSCLEALCCAFGEGKALVVAHTVQHQACHVSHMYNSPVHCTTFCY